MTQVSSGPDVSLLEYWHHKGYERARADTEDFLTMIRPLTSEQMAAPVPGLNWRVVDVIAHVASVYRRYTTNPQRASDRHDLARLNAQEAAELGEDLPTLITEIQHRTEQMAGLPGLPDPAAQYPFHAGQTITIAGGWGNLIGELLAHGDDVARALDLTWSVPGADLEPFWRFTARALPGWLAPSALSASDRWRLDLGFASGPVDLAFDHGSVAIDDGSPDEPDHVLDVDPVAFTLAVPYRRAPAPNAEVAQLQARIDPL